MKNALTGLNDSMARLKRAQRLKEREDRFVPVYGSLVDNESGRLGVLDSMILVCMNSAATVEQKVRFCFDCFDFDQKRFATSKFHFLAGNRYQNSRTRRRKLTDREVENMAMRAFIEKKIKQGDGHITVHDFEDWAIDVVTRVKDLSEAFRVVWKYGALSEFEERDVGYTYVPDWLNFSAICSGVLIANCCSIKMS